MAQAPQSTGITRHFSMRLLPLSLGIGLLIAFAAPVLYRALGHRSLQHQTSLYAGDLAGQITHLAMESPSLWKYQTYKFISIAEGFRPTLDVIGFRVLDEKGEPITGHAYTESGIEHTGALSATEELEYTLGTAPILFNNRQVGTVEVTVSDAYLLWGTSLLFCIAAVLGTSLAVLVYRFPIRIVKGAEAALLESERKFRNLAEESLVGIYIIQDEVVGVSETA